MNKMQDQVFADICLHQSRHVHGGDDGGVAVLRSFHMPAKANAR